MSAAERLGWTLDDLHERVAACEAVIDGLAKLEPDDRETWTASASLTFLRLSDELLSLGKEFKSPVPPATLRRIGKLDEKLSGRDVSAAAGRLRSWLLRQESELSHQPAPEAAPPGAEAGDNLVTLPRGAHPSNEKERLRGLRTERWVAVPRRADVRKRVGDVREALGGLALVLSAANAEDDVPFGTLDRKRLALVVDSARHTLAGPLAERGLLKAVLDNAAVMERQGGSQAVRATSKRTRIALELLLSELR